MRKFALFVLLTSSTLFAEEPKTPDYPDHQDLSYYLTADGARHAIKTKADWEIRRNHILANVQKVMGKLPQPDQPVALDVKELESIHVGSFTRKKLAYHTDSPDRRVHAYLLIPDGLLEPAPAVLCLHQTTPIGKEEPAGLGTRKNLQYAKHLAERGYVTLAPDYPSFGEYKYDFPASDGYTSGSMKAIYDNVRAVDVLASLKEVDPNRIGCIGHSLGGHNSIFTAVFDPRIKAIVSNCGFTRFHKYYDGKLKGWTSSRYMPLIDTQHGNDPDRVPFDFPELLACLAPRAFLASSPTHDDNFEVSGVRDSVASAQPIFKLLGAERKLQANYPDCAHDFPPEVRDVAYKFLDEQLK
jgi:dipeptidyl aminopeptidase/acylaminoacyl peptidase